MLAQSSAVFFRRRGIALSGVAAVAFLATLIARQPEAGGLTAALATLELDKEEYNIGDAPNVTVRVEPITAVPSMDVLASVFYSEEPDPLTTSILPAVVVGIVPNGDGTVVLQMNEITCIAPQLFLQGTITDPVSGQIFEVTNEDFVKINYDQGTDPAGAPDCVFQDIDIDGDGVPEFPADDPGGEGCPSGFWKGVAENTPEQFPLPLRPSNPFSSIFEDAFPGLDLRDVLSSPNSPLNKLGRETVAALLNAQDNRVDYDLDVEEVIQLFNEVFPGTPRAYNDLKEFFKMFNNQGGSGACLNFTIGLDPYGGGSVGGLRR